MADDAQQKPAEKKTEEKAPPSFWSRVAKFVRGLTSSGRALLTLFGAMLVGVGAALIYALNTPDRGEFLSDVSLSLMVAGAAAALGGITGFLFGIPRTASAADATYKANTNLEDVSDWLTKMLIGVGLTQIHAILGKLRDVSESIGAGLGGTSSDTTFALSLIVYNLVVGFLFAYLWARLFMASALARADEAISKRMADLAADTMETKAELETMKASAELDAEATSLATQQINSSPNAEQVDPKSLRDAIGKASQKTRRQIYELAWNTRSATWRDDKSKMALTIPIFEALIEHADQEYHTNYGQLGFALKDKEPPDWAGAEAALSKAIEIRGPWRETGRWLYYEFNRALCRIALDERFNRGLQSTDERRDAIVADLAGAHHAGDVQPKLDAPPISTWMLLNKVTKKKLDQVAAQPGD